MLNKRIKKYSLLLNALLVAGIITVSCQQKEEKKTSKTETTEQTHVEKATTETAKEATGGGNEPVIDETQLGLRKSSLEEETPPPPVEYTKAPPGQSQRFERSYQNAPPLIPHSVEGLLPITKDNNACLNCHDPKVAKTMGATPISPTHYIDFGKLPEGKVVKLSHIDPARWNCVQCHVPQANAKPLVENTFQPDYEDPEAKKKSKLDKELMEGVY